MSVVLYPLYMNKWKYLHLYSESLAYTIVDSSMERWKCLRLYSESLAYTIDDSIIGDQLLSTLFIL